MRCFTIFRTRSTIHSSKAYMGTFLKKMGLVCSCVNISSSILTIWSNIAYTSAPPSQCGMLPCAAPGVHRHYMTTLHWSRPRTLTLASLGVKCYHRHHTLPPPHVSWAYLLAITYHGRICQSFKQILKFHNPCWKCLLELWHSQDTIYSNCLPKHESRREIGCQHKDHDWQAVWLE